MDTAQAFTHLSLCTGYCSIDLGLRRTIPSLRTVAYSEIEAFAAANLVAKMEAGLLDAAPVWTNLKTFPWGEFRGKVRFLTGGYPCQPFSSAGRRLGTEDPRHLWPFILAGIKVCLPDLCLFENVEGHISLGLRDVLHDLETAGYRVAAGLFSASEVGAPHQRKRIFIMAHRQGAGLERLAGDGDGIGEPGRIGASPLGCATDAGVQPWPARPGEDQYGWEPSRTVLGNFSASVRAAKRAGELADGNGFHEHRSGNSGKTGRFESPDQSGRKPESALGRNSDGHPGGVDYAWLSETCESRVDELRMLGNGAVPAAVCNAFWTLYSRLNS